MTFWSHRNRLQLLPALAIAWLLSVFISYSEAKLIHRYGLRALKLQLLTQLARSTDHLKVVRNLLDRAPSGSMELTIL